MGDVEELDLGAAGDSPDDDTPAVADPPAPRRASRGKPRSARSRSRSKPAAASAPRPLSGAAASAVNEKAVKDLHENKVAPVVMYLFMKQSPAVRPLDNEVDSVFMPLERVWLRRVGTVNIPLSPDALDLMQSGAGLIGYLSRIRLIPSPLTLLGLLFKGKSKTTAAAPSTRPAAPTPPPAPTPAPAGGTADEQLAQLWRDTYEAPKAPAGAGAGAL